MDARRGSSSSAGSSRRSSGLLADAEAVRAVGGFRWSWPRRSRRRAEDVGWSAVSPALVAAQIRGLRELGPVDAVKLGMIPGAAQLRRCGGRCGRAGPVGGRPGGAGLDGAGCELDRRESPPARRTGGVADAERGGGGVVSCVRRIADAGQARRVAELFEGWGRGGGGEGRPSPGTDGGGRAREEGQGAPLSARPDYRAGPRNVARAAGSRRRWRPKLDVEPRRNARA